MSERRVCVVGAGGHAKVVISTLLAAGHHPAAVFDDDEAKWGGTVLGIPVLGGPDLMRGEPDLVGVLGVGDNRARKALAARLDCVAWMSVVHPFAFVDTRVRLGAGTVVFAGAVIQPDTEIGAHCIVNTGASVDHDCRLGDFVHVAPGVHFGGNVIAGEGAFLGVGVSVAPGRSIGPWAIVGAGATVLRNIPPGSTAVGTPARPIRSTRGSGCSNQEFGI
jgi:sugar O-acyltransferase (sialic acid O-acetyltransferase NeuD family)